MTHFRHGTHIAAITKRAKGWSVQIRRKGYEPEYKTLPFKAAVEKWAREREGRTDKCEEPTERRLVKATTLGDLIQRHPTEVTPIKLSADTERLRLSKMLKTSMRSINLLDLTSAPVATYRDVRFLIPAFGRVKLIGSGRARRA